MAKKNDAATRAAALAAQMQQEIGVDAVMLACDMPCRPATTSGSLALNYATGIGGLPSDRLIEISGKEGTGKTALALLSMAEVLDANPDRMALLLDLEHKMTKDWLIDLVGEDRAARTMLFWPDDAEHATNYYRMMVGGDDKLKIAPGQFCFALFDSIGGAPTMRFSDDATKGRVGGNSLAIGEFARSAAVMSNKYICQTIGVNQVRADMQGFHRLVVPGGQAWLHAVSMRLWLKQGRGKAVEKVNNEEVQVGYEISCKIMKNGLAAPYRVASWWFYNVPTEKYGFGIDTLEEIVRLGTLTEVIERRGGWYHHPALPEVKAEHKVLGRDKLIDYLREHPDSQKAISADVIDRLKTGEFGAQVAPIEPEEMPAIEKAGYTNLASSLASGATPFDEA